MSAITIELTPEERADIIRDVKADCVRRLMEDECSRLKLLSAAQVCGLLNCSLPTLEGYDIPRISTGNRSVLYLASDVATWIEERRAIPDAKRKGGAR